MKITIEQHNGVSVLRDDLLPGGTKACFIGELLAPSFACHVYASPVYGAFQIALAEELLLGTFKTMWTSKTLDF